MNYIVYNFKTGEIVRTGVCEDWEHLEMQAGPEENAIQGDANDHTHRVDVKTRKLVALPPEPPKVLTASEARRLEYPSMLIFVDAQVKKGSPDPAVRAEGQAQEAKYLADCLAVKERHPK